MFPYSFYRNYLTPSLPYPRPYRKPFRAVEALRQWVRSAARRWERRKMIAALEALDNRLLRDIGVYRNDISRFVDGLDDRELLMRPLADPAAEPAEIYDDSYRRAA